MHDRIFTAWACVDVTGKKPPDAHDIFHSRERARTFKEIREGVSYPLHPGAKWRVFKVKIEVLK